MAEPTDATLLGWLQPATGAALTADDAAEYQAAIGAVLAKLSSSRAVGLVEAACGEATDDDRTWVADQARTKRADVPLVDNTDLVARLSSASIARACATPKRGSAILLALLVESAQFLGLTPRIEDVAAFARAALADAAASARRRPEAWEPIQGAVEAALDGPTSETNEAGEVTEIDVHGNAIIRLAEAVDGLATRVDDRFRTVDEEYDALWWSYSGRSEERGKAWEGVDPLALRAVLVAKELGGHIQRIPSPPIVRGLIAAALGKAAEQQVSLEEVALAAASEGLYPGTTRCLRLLPIESAVAEIRRVGDDDGTWKKSLKKLLPVNVGQTATALDAACQLRREEEIGGLGV